MNAGFEHYLVLSALLFSIGLYGLISRSNIVAILMAIEIMFNAVNIALVATSRFLRPLDDVTGQVFAVFIITVAAAEATVGLALVVAIYRRRQSVDVEQVNLMRW